MNGEKLSLSQIACQYGFAVGTIYQRYRNGARDEELVEPLRHSAGKANQLSVDDGGRLMSISAYALHYQLNELAVRNAFRYLQKEGETVIKADCIRRYLEEIQEDRHAHMPSKTLVMDDQEITRHQLAKRLGVNMKTIRDRTPRDGERLVTKEKLLKEKRRINHRVKIGNVTYSLPELADAFNLSVETVYSRWKRGKRGEELIKPVR
ncbi:hypothetical protein ACLOA0_06675 [Limosilactobacillus fermentum]|uniref:Uncharacterized protein n=1 Tax=Limosilactobacillus fermentum TaxID=1613 RepID=A0ABD0AIH7_LIMFE|nr:hypothetical protein [Limosilactobacillus fermentum]GIC71073.1 hypothetical protein LF01B1_00880 [Limosilactobacillus fermentum]SJM57678.1 hypothetical protein FM123_06375 [Limosilactobacillus fermentum]SJM59189.1 hypothetical protein FM122_08810 [Limosilactobacillus fermentum]